MDERMTQAAESGDINALHQLIGEDVNLLDRIDQVPCVQTPLHIAASAEHIQFAMEMMRLKPSFARKLNPDGLSPIHLALKNGHIELVPIGDHHIDLLEKFLLVCPDTIVDVTVRDETALHIALKNDQLEAFKFLVGWLRRNFFKNSPSNVKAILDQKDDEGNTVLHITVSKNRTQVVRHLLTWVSRFVDVNSTNLEGKTALDISQGQTQVNNKEIKLMLHSARASSGSSLSTATRSDDNNTDEFYNLIGEDIRLLEYIDELPFVNTPFHIAASYGNIQFALEMMSLKPSFVRKLDPNGFSPIHLALQNGHIELVRRLLELDGDLVRVKGRERLTPLHYAIESGERLNLLDEFLLLCPDSITDVTVRNETALHIALKYNRLEAFQFLVEWLANNSSENAKFSKKTVINWQDNEGNTVLHILVSKDETQAVRDFLSWGNRFLDVNSKNLEDKTAWDILREDNREIRYMLSRVGAKPGLSLSTFTFWLRRTFIFWPANFRHEIRKVTEERRGMLLVVVALLATLSFQAVLTPPGGLWQDNGQCQPYSYPFNSSSNYPKLIYLSNTTILACEHIAGTAIALEDGIFFLFLVCNTSLFSISTSLIVLLILNFHIKALFLVLNIILCLSYFYSVWTITGDSVQIIPLAFGASLYFVYIQLLSWKQ